jgi:anthranilate phosphoribosyltransferase
MAALKGGDAFVNAVIVKAVLAGEPGPQRDIVLLNAAYALVASGKVTIPAKGMELAAEAIDSGRALEQLEKLAALTNQE